MARPSRIFSYSLMPAASVSGPLLSRRSGTASSGGPRPSPARSAGSVSRSAFEFADRGPTFAGSRPLLQHDHAVRNAEGRVHLVCHHDAGGTCCLLGQRSIISSSMAVEVTGSRPADWARRRRGSADPTPTPAPAPRASSARRRAGCGHLVAVSSSIFGPAAASCATTMSMIDPWSTCECSRSGSATFSATVSELNSAPDFGRGSRNFLRTWFRVSSSAETMSISGRSGRR
jgi:hypothetical protein